MEENQEKCADYTERWFALETMFAEEIEEYWGDWGVDSEVGKLRAVLLRRPGKEIENIVDPQQWRWIATMNPDVAREQHDAFAECYRSHGVKVHYVAEQRTDRPNALYMRDNVFMTPEGAIIARQALSVRRGEEKAVQKTLAALGVPIILTVHGRGIFEGACAMWVDRETVILGKGVRSNFEGILQVRRCLETIGVKTFIEFEIPYGHAHIDGILNFVDRDKALIFPWQTPYYVWKQLRELGFKILEAPYMNEVKQGLSVNVVALEPGRVIMPAGSPCTKRLLEDKGIEVVEIEISELLKGAGGPHCMTGVLRRNSP